MIIRTHQQDRRLPTAAGAVVSLVGAGFVGLGLWGLRETRSALTRERIEGPDGIGRVCTAGGARAMAEFIRQNLNCSNLKTGFLENTSGLRPGQVFPLASRGRIADG